MTTITRVRHINDRTVFELTGPNGAVTFDPSFGIQLHSSVECWSPAHEVENCPHAPGRCWEDGSCSQGAKLRERWESAGHANDVVWTELKAWYDGHFATA